MFFKRMRQIKGRDDPQESATQKSVRRFAVIVLCVLVVLGFWKNGEQQAQHIRMQSAGRIDRTGQLTPRQISVLNAYAKRFQATYGTHFELRVQPEAFSTNFVYKSDAIFLGISPPHRQVVFVVPPVIRAAIGDDFINYLQKEHFIPYFARGAWQEGLVQALNRITARFDALLISNHPDKKHIE